MPGYFIMHLPDRARLKYVKASGNIPLFLVDYIQRFPGLALPIPHLDRSASRKRAEMLFGREHAIDDPREIETIADLQKAHLYQGELIAACASAVAGNPKRFTDTSDFLQSTRTAPTIHPGSEEVSASRYLSLNPELPGLRKSTRQAHQVRYDALELFRLSAIEATHIQPICAPLNADFPLSAVVQFAQEQLPLESFICQGHDDPARCRSDHCCGRVLEFPRPFTTSGRPIGIDSDLVLPLMNQAQVTRLPYRRPLNRAEMITVSLFLQNVSLRFPLIA
ncbi:hypothetical protein CPB85DRAFT_757224 [Mucidula mucida]|nr:hypothetical protein CPB85DRAFT_757224 [Mucidula mucida]